MVGQWNDDDRTARDQDRSKRDSAKGGKEICLCYVHSQIVDVAGAGCTFLVVSHLPTLRGATKGISERPSTPPQRLLHRMAKRCLRPPRTCAMAVTWRCIARRGGKRANVQKRQRYKPGCSREGRAQLSCIHHGLTGLTLLEWMKSSCFFAASRFRGVVAS